MRWKDGRRSDNVEDRRGESPRYSAAGAAPVLLRFLPALVRTKFGRTILIVGVVVIFGGRMLGVDVLSMFLGGGGATSASSPQLTEQQQEMADFVSVVLADTEDTWNNIFRAQGKQYFPCRFRPCLRLLPYHAPPLDCRLIPGDGTIK